MKVLFVVKHDPQIEEKAPFIKAQMDSISKLGVDVSYFPVTGKGLSGYLKSSFRLRRYLKKNPVDIIHAHYSLCGLTSLLGFSGKPVVVSLMGSDALGIYKSKNSITNKSKVVVVLTFLMQPFLSGIICKSARIYRRVYRKKNAVIIPNGVDMVKFTEVSGHDIRNEFNLEKNSKIVFFPGNPENQWKNFPLAKAAVEMLGDNNIRLVAPFPVSQDQVVNYLNAADLMLVTSFNEGSSNVIKEAMACNCPIVSTKVGDAEWVTGGIEGCYLTSFDPEDVAEKIRLAARFAEENGRTHGRERILELGLDSETIAGRIAEVYEKVLHAGDKC